MLVRMCRFCARPGVHAERVGLVVDLELLAVEHGGQGALGVVDLDGDELRVHPVELEEAADHLVEFGPGAHLGVAALRDGAGCRAAARGAGPRRSRAAKFCWLTLPALSVSSLSNQASASAFNSSRLSF